MKHQCCWYSDFAVQFYKLDRVTRKPKKKLTPCCVIGSNIDSCLAPRNVRKTQAGEKKNIFIFGQDILSDKISCGHLSNKKVVGLFHFIYLNGGLMYLLELNF